MQHHELVHGVYFGLHLGMDKNAKYVWQAWALSVLVIGGLTTWTILTARAAARELSRREGDAR